VSRDITERKQAARDLERSLALLQATLEATTNSILVTDLQGHLLVHNRLLTQMWGLESPHLKPEAEADRTHHMAQQMQDPQPFLTLIEELLVRPGIAGSAHFAPGHQAPLDSRHHHRSGVELPRHHQQQKDRTDEKRICFYGQP
jgi:PAS domain-containing protein